jgi:hypothetical protein
MEDSFLVIPEVLYFKVKIAYGLTQPVGKGSGADGGKLSYNKRL